MGLRLGAIPLTLLAAAASNVLFSARAFNLENYEDCSLLYAASETCNVEVPESFLPAPVAEAAISGGKPRAPDMDVLADVMDALRVMQDEYFEPWRGTWPTSIDWTGAVMGTHVSGALRSITDAFSVSNLGNDTADSLWAQGNFVGDHFAQLISYYFGEEAMRIRDEAYDDILWVVLGWVEAVRYVNKQTDVYESTLEASAGADRLGSILANQTWHGNRWIPAFAHRARIFWGLASEGWDEELCGGGMVWNPRLGPYKNAITNELFISASVAMYLYFPGDDNKASWWRNITDDPHNPRDPRTGTTIRAKDPVFLKAAVDGYRWLISSGMTNDQGLFTDGFHVSGLDDPKNNNTKCDMRDELVFTYNQGVLLSGQRGLWDATLAPSYLAAGHQLIQNAIAATGYNLAKDKPEEDVSGLKPGKLPKWYGLGRAGIMEDMCDAVGECSQDVQTFKGIFFHHLSEFCSPLGPPPTEPSTRFDARLYATVKKSHEESCAAYGGWLRHNAEAAINTRDADGRFGGWWTAGLLKNWAGPWPTIKTDGIEHRDTEVDYRNYGVPDDPVWLLPAGWVEKEGRPEPAGRPVGYQKPLGGAPRLELRKRSESRVKDPNSRGRGRTVETQGSTLALMRAYWSIAHAPLHV